MATLSPAFVRKFRKTYEKGGPGGHDITHVERMLKLGPRVHRIVDFDPDEYQAAVWLHNADRYKNFARQISKIGVIGFCLRYLTGSGFSEEAQLRIAEAVAQHSKFMDGPEDSTLLAALRIADKLDRFGALGVMSIGANGLPPYDTMRPFGYGATAEEKIKSLYGHYFRVLEWYGMLPSDTARALVPKGNFRFFIGFIRQLGREIATATGAKNMVEADIAKALGPYYTHWQR